MASILKSRADYETYNPFRRVNWRFERVLALLDRDPPGRPTKRDDDYVREARAFVQKWRHLDPDDREEQLFFAHPGLYYAYQMHEREVESEDNTLYLQARLLAGMPTQKICEATSMHPDAVDWYERLFFNVRPYLKQRDWVQSQILVPAMVRNFVSGSGTDIQLEDSVPAFAKPFKDASLKMFAYYAGPVMCEYMIAGFQQGKMLDSVDRLGQYLDDHWKMAVRARSAQVIRTCSVNKYNVMQLFEIHNQIIAVETSGEAENQKQNAITAHVGALLTQIPWAVGQEGAAKFAGTAVGRYDEGAAELRDDELLLTSAGEGDRAGVTDMLATLALPPARRKADVKETANDGKPAG